MKNKINLIFLFFTTIIFAQQVTLSGKVTNLLDGESLFGVNITTADFKIGTTTNEYGFYTISLPRENQKIIFSYVGFNTKTKQINLVENQTLNIELTEESNTLEEVTISTREAKIRNKIKKPQMSVTQLSVKTIKQIPVVLGEVDILKAITLLPGVTTNGEGSAGFNVRGGAADQNLVLLDEATIYNTSHLFGFFSVFNADAIKDINLYKGGMPAKFGGRVASVLDVRQKDGNSKEFHAVGGIGLISSRLMVEGPLKKDKASFLLAGRTSYVNMFLKAENNNNRVGFYDLNVKLSYEINDNNKLFLSSYFGKDNFKIENFFENSYGNNTFNLRWNHLFNSRFFSNLSLIYSKYDYNLNFNLLEFEWVSDIVDTNLKYDLKYSINDTHKLNFGVNIINYNFNPGELNKTSETSSINEDKLAKKFAVESAVYAELEHKVSNKLNLRYGLRFSSFYRIGKQTMQLYSNDLPIIYNENLGIYERADPIGEMFYDKNKTIASFNGLEPRASLAYQLNYTTSIKASYQNVNQYIHLISNTNSATPLDVWAPSGKYIKPQKSNQYAVGFFKNLKGENYSLEIETYYKDVNNRIDYIDGANLIANNTLETEILAGKSRAYGLEILVKKNKGKFTGWFSYTLSKSEQKIEGRTAIETGINNGNWYNTPYDRTHDLSITGSYNYNKKWRFGSNFIFQTGRPANYPSGQYQFEETTVPVFVTRNAERLPAYHRLDISATLTPKKKVNRKWKSEWVFGIYNLYARRNAASITFGRNEDSGLNEATRTSIFGIMPAITYNFKF
ncbi:MAG: TonB-dependent receptor [Flavobacteriaceae bacterium]|nr:TonB-dependent receptor [Flavobacteriaceae bacterium]